MTPRWLYRWVEQRGRIPFWVRWIWPKAHWCQEMDELLIIDNVEDCFCHVCADERAARESDQHDRDVPMF